MLEVGSGWFPLSAVWRVSLSIDSHESVGEPELLTRDTSERNNYPGFSPDGQTIVFRHSLQGAASNIWSMDANGDNPRALTSGGNYGAPEWLRGSDRIALWSPADLQALTLATGRLEVIHVLDADQVGGSISPDARTLAFASRRGGPVNVWTVPLGGTEERQLTFDDQGAGFPAWSPDGTSIAVQLRRGADDQIAVIPATGGELVQLTHDPGQSWHGGWSPDGNKIAFAGRRGDAWNLRWVSRSDGRQVRLTDYQTLHHYVRGPAWSPLGDQIVYEYSEVSGDIWLVDLH